MERCSGYFCENAFSHRVDAFKSYSLEQDLRFLTMTCGGCSKRAVERKMEHVLKNTKAKDKILEDDIVVHLASCIANDNHHGHPALILTI